MSSKSPAPSSSPLPPGARVLARLDADDALLATRPSPSRRSAAIGLALLMLAAVPLFWAANGAGIIGDVPAAVAKGKGKAGVYDGGEDRRGPAGDRDGGFADTDDTSGDGKSTRGTTDDADTRTRLGTDDTSRNAKSTRGTTRDNDTRTRLGTDDTSRYGKSTRGTTRDNDTRTRTGSQDADSGRSGGGVATDSGGAQGDSADSGASGFGASISS